MARGIADPALWEEVKAMEDDLLTAQGKLAQAIADKREAVEKWVFVSKRKEELEERLKQIDTKNGRLESELSLSMKKVTELEVENARLREKGAELENVPVQGGDGEEWLDCYPMCKKIRDLHLAGNTRDEIRLALFNMGYPNAQTAFLTQEDTSIRTDNAQKQTMKRAKNNA